MNPKDCFVLFTISLCQAWAASPASKDSCTLEKLRMREEWIRVNSTRKDVSEWIKKGFEMCPNMVSVLSKEKAQEYARAGKIHEKLNAIPRTLDEAEAASHYRDVGAEMQSYELLINETGQAADQARVQEIINRSKTNRDGEKKNCSTIDLRNRFGPVRDQDDVGWCYAFADADLLSFKAGFRVSAADIAVNNTMNIDSSHRKRLKNKLSELDSKLEGGDPLSAGRFVSKKGLCREADSPSEYFGEDKNMATFIEDLEKSASKTWDQYLLAKRTPAAEIPKKCSPKVRQVAQLEDVIRKSMPADVMYNLNESRCKGEAGEAGSARARALRVLCA